MQNTRALRYGSWLPVLALAGGLALAACSSDGPGPGEEAPPEPVNPGVVSPGPAVSLEEAEKRRAASRQKSSTPPSVPSVAPPARPDAAPPLPEAAPPVDAAPGSAGGNADAATTTEPDRPIVTGEREPPDLPDPVEKVPCLIDGEVKTVVAAFCKQHGKVLL